MDITPADVAECLTTALRAGYGEDSAMEFLIEELKKKKREEAKAAEANVFEYSDEVEGDGQEIEYSDEVKADRQEIENLDEVKEDGQKKTNTQMMS